MKKNYIRDYLKTKIDQNALIQSKVFEHAINVLGDFVVFRSDLKLRYY